MGRRHFYINHALSAFIITPNCRSTDITNHIQPEGALNYFVFPSLLIKLKICVQLPHSNRGPSFSWGRRGWHKPPKPPKQCKSCAFSGVTSSVMSQWVKRSWEGGSGGRGDMYTFSWFTSLYSRNWPNIVKQRYSKKKIIVNVIFNSSLSTWLSLLTSFCPYKQYVNTSHKCTAVLRCRTFSHWKDRELINAAPPTARAAVPLMHARALRTRNDRLQKAQKFRRACERRGQAETTRVTIPWTSPCRSKHCSADQMGGGMEHRKALPSRDS